MAKTRELTKTNKEAAARPVKMQKPDYWPADLFTAKNNASSALKTTMHKRFLTIKYFLVIVHN